TVAGTGGGPASACRKAGCVEAWVARPTLRRALEEADSESARQDVLAEAGRRLGIVIAPVIGALNLTEVVLSGPSKLLEGPFLESTEQTVRERLIAAEVEPSNIRTMPDSTDAVLRGAAAIVLASEL